MLTRDFLWPNLCLMRTKTNVTNNSQRGYGMFYKTYSLNKFYKMMGSDHRRLT